jgi:hypothetical protein
MLSALAHEREVRSMFGEFDCGCDDRKTIMGAENWQLDASVVVAAIVITVIALVVVKSK